MIMNVRDLTDGDTAALTRRPRSTSATCCRSGPPSRSSSSSPCRCCGGAPRRSPPPAPRSPASCQPRALRHEYHSLRRPVPDRVPARLRRRRAAGPPRRAARPGLITGSMTVLDLAVEFDAATAAVFAAVTAAMWGVGRHRPRRAARLADELARADRGAARARATSVPGWRSPPTARGSPPRARRAAAAAPRRELGRLADAGVARRRSGRGDRDCSRRSSARAAARWRRCARWSACCAPTRRRPDRAAADAHPPRSRCSPARRARDARLTVEGSPRALPAAVELSAYRIVEHLLDALEDAPGRRRSACASATTRVELRSPGRRAGARGRRSSGRASARGCSAGRSRRRSAAVAPRPSCPCRCWWWREVALLVRARGGAARRRRAGSRRGST